jgi:hypothetical protein
MAVSGGRVVYPYADRGTDWTRVAVLDPRTGKASDVAHSAFEHGLVNWVGGTGSWVAWVDQSRRQSDSDPDVLWRVHALDTASGTTRLLASNGDRPDPFVPIVHGGDGYLFWTQAEADRTAREVVWRPGRSAARTLLSHAELSPGSETAADGQLVYLGRAAPDAAHGRRHTVGGDCWTVPLDGRDGPAPLTHTALAMGCAASQDGHLVWSEHIDPSQRPLPPDGVLDDPYSIWAATNGQRAHRLHRGYVAFGSPRAGTGYSLWRAQTGRVVVRALGSKEQLTLPADADPLTVTTDGGDMLAYAARRGGSTTVTLVRVDTGS